MRYARLLTVAVAATVLLTGTPRFALGAPSPAERAARRQFDEGEVQYRAGHYTQALTKYQAGYAAMPLAGFLVNIAQCQRRLGDLKAARASYRTFVLVAPDSRLVPEVQILIKELDGLIDEQATGAPAVGAAGGGTDVHASDPAASPLALDAPEPTTGTALVATPDERETGGATAVATHRQTRWWLWGSIVAAGIVGGVVTGVALSSPGTTTVRAGTLGTLGR